MGLSKMNTPSYWWRTYELQLGEVGHWKIGPLELMVRRLEHEWQVYSASHANPFEESIQIELPVLEPNLDLFRRDREGGSKIRVYSMDKTASRITFRPRLADRPVISRPNFPFHILPSGRVEVFLSTALWLELCVGESFQPFAQIPIFRPSDTWFGNSLDGELCYASRTYAHLNPDDLNRYPYRAMSSLVLKNHTKETLSLERLKIPVPYLSLFEVQGEHSTLCTETLFLEMKDDTGLAEVTIKKAPHPIFGTTRKIRSPRVVSDRNIVTRMFNSFLSSE